MLTRRIDALVSGLRAGWAMVFFLWLVALAGCTQEPKPGVESKPGESKSALRRVEPGKESGFLQDYSKLKPMRSWGVTRSRM